MKTIEVVATIIQDENGRQKGVKRGGEKSVKSGPSRLGFFANE